MHYFDIFNEFFPRFFYSNSACSNRIRIIFDILFFYQINKYLICKLLSHSSSHYYSNVYLIILCTILRFLFLLAYFLLSATNVNNFILLYQSSFEFILYKCFINERKTKNILENDLCDMSSGL